jgi:hypothetical protein
MENPCSVFYLVITGQQASGLDPTTGDLQAEALREPAEKTFAPAPEQPYPNHLSNSASSKTVMLSLRITEATADALARTALGSGRTQRHIVAKALQVAGIEVHPDDLHNRPPHRRRV